MFIKLLKSTALFLLAGQKIQEIDAPMIKKTMDEIDHAYFPQEVKERVGLPLPYADESNGYRSNRLNMFNTLKGLALGLDACFKANNQSHVKYHLVASAVYQAIYDLFEAEDMDALRAIFGNVIEDQHTLHVMRSMVIDIVEEAQAAQSDSSLNNVLNNWRTVDQKGRFQSYVINEPEVSTFRGRVVINHSYQKKPVFETGDVVNVVLTIDRRDVAALVQTVKPQLQELGLEVGRLTGTTDTDERHVSLGLRMPYTEKLAEVVGHMNEKVLPQLTFKTAAQLRVVTPMDIRSSRSAISLLDEDTVHMLQQLQKEIVQASGNTGNQLPQLHITHGNSPIAPVSLSELERLRHLAPRIDAHLKAFNLDLPTAIASMDNLEPQASNSLYLVCHDHTRNHDEASGYKLPRLGIVNLATGGYETVSFAKEDPLYYSNDLEALTAFRGNEYLTCQSNGACYHFSLDSNSNGYTAKTLNVIQLPIPMNTFVHIEGLTATYMGHNKFKICYDHRGGIYLGQNAWTRCLSYEGMQVSNKYEETPVIAPFPVADPLHIAVADHALARQTGRSYFVGTVNMYALSQIKYLGIISSVNHSFSFIYTHESCIKYLDQEIVQALYVHDDETLALVATDDDRPDAEKVCQFSLQNPEEPMLCHKIPHGMGGIASVRDSFFYQRLKPQEQRPHVAESARLRCF